MNMAAIDILDQLLRTCGLTEIERARMASWWRAEREGEEELPAFLCRRGYLSRTCLRQIDCLLRGYLTSSEGIILFDEQNLKRLRENLNEFRPEVQEFSFDDLPAAPGAKTDRVATPLLPHPVEPSSRPGPLDTGHTRPGSSTEHARTANTLADSAESGLPRIGCIIGKCLLTELVGRGATGVVFRGLHRSLNIPVAVKVLHLGGLEHDASIRQQLRSEARLLAQLNHPHVVRVWDFDDEGAFPYLILEYVEGLSLAELIQQSGRLRWDRAREVISQVARGLAAATKLGIIHRDVKPANILLSRDGAAKLGDLGLAVVASTSALAQAGAASSETGMAGTAAYMSPEQARGESIDHRSDIYGLGATLYHAITGRLPFIGRSRMEVIMKHAREQPVPPHELVPELPPGVSTVLSRMLAKDPNDRFANYEELQKGLDSLEEARVDLDAPVVTEIKESKSKGRLSIWRTVLGTLKGKSEEDASGSIR